MSDNVNRGVHLFLNLEDIIAQLEKAQAKAARLEKQMTDVADKSSPEFLKLEKQLASTNNRISDLQKTVDGKLGPSLRQMESATRKAWNELQNMPVGTSEWKAKMKEFNNLNEQFIKVKSSVGAVGRVLQSFGDQIKSVAAGVLIGNTVQAAAQSVLGYFQGALSSAAKISDELSDIQKTTGLTTDEVRQLNSELVKIRTRTSTSELRQIAAVGGQFNVAKKDLAGFTEAVDRANVALGDEFGGGAENVATQLAKLRNIFTDVKSDHIDQDLLHIGNALKSLGNAGVATSDVVADFSNRIAGVGIPLGLTTGQVLGISATLQELGVNAERGGTAVSKILQKMTVNVDEFSKVAGVSVSEFEHLLNTDLYKAFQLVVEGSGKAGASATAMANLLKDAELQGAGAAEVFLKLGNNTQLMSEKVDLAGKALKGTDSIMQEFNSKNNNLAADLELIQKRIAKFFSGMNPLIENVVGNITDLIRVQDDETKELEKNRRGLEVNLIALKDVNLSNEARTKLIQETNDKYGEYLPRLLDEKDTLADINKLQEESNKLLLTRILTISYQKEFQKILEDQKSALEGYVQTQISSAKLTSEGSDKGLNPAEIDKQQQLLKNVGNVQKEVAGNTDKLVEQLKEKYKLLAGVAGVVFDEIINGTDKTVTTSAKKTESMLKATGTALKDLSKQIQDEMDKLGKANLDKEEEEYALRVSMLNRVYDEARLANKKDLAQGIIDQEEYNNRIIGLDIQQTGARLALARQYQDGKNKATEDVAQLEIDYQNKVLDEYVRVNKAISASDEARTNQELENARKVGQAKLEAIRTYGGAALEVNSAVVDLFNTAGDQQISNEEKKTVKLKAELKKQVDNGIISKEEYNRKSDAIDEKQAKKARDIKKKQFIAEKAAKVIEIGLNTVSAIAEANPNVALMALAGITGALQLAVALATPVPEYGKGKEPGKRLNGPSHKNRSRGLHVVDPETGKLQALFEGKEWLVNARSSEKFDGLLGAVNRDDEAAINRWFLNRPNVNLSGILPDAKISFANSTGTNYDDERLRRTVNNGFHYSSSFIVDGIVSGLTRSDYIKTRRL